MKKIVTFTLLLMISQAYSQIVPKKVIIDCDPGIDDAMALFYALQSPDLEVIGITTTFGNTSTQLSTENALRILEFLGKNIPVYEGSHFPLLLPKHKPADHVHGQDGLGNLNLAKPKGGKQEKDAMSYLIETCKNSPKEITIITLGSLTNLALASKMDSTFVSTVKEVVIMGGAAFTQGNVTPVAEANILDDPQAADIVLTADWKTNMVGLDVTTKVLVDSSMLESLKTKKPKQAEFLLGISTFYQKFYESIGVKRGFYFHDPTAIIYVTNKEFFETVSAPIRVVYDGIAMGQTIVNTGRASKNRRRPWYKKAPVEIAINVQPDKVVEKFFEVIKNSKN